MSGHTLFLSSHLALSLPFVLLPRGSLSLEDPSAAFQLLLFKVASLLARGEGSRRPLVGSRYIITGS